MVASAVYILDLKGKVLISRNYRGDISPTAVDKFMQLLLDDEAGEEDGSGEGYSPPVLTLDGVNYLYFKHNNLYCDQNRINCFNW